MFHGCLVLLSLWCLFTAPDYGTISIWSASHTRHQEQGKETKPAPPLQRGEVATAIFPDPSWQGIQKLQTGDKVTVLYALPVKTGKQVELHKFMEHSRIYAVAGKPGLDGHPLVEGTIVLVMKHEQLERLSKLEVQGAKIILIRADASDK